VAGVYEVRIYRRPGDHIVQHGDFRDRLGHIISVADTSNEARDAIERARLEINLTI
jgi:biotin carboxylase